jgi:hypothetical protein
VNFLVNLRLTHTQNLSGKIEALKVRQADFDDKAAEHELSVEELAELRSISSDIHSLSRLNASIC